MNMELLRKICLSFPAVTEDIKWGADLVFSVGGKMFCAALLEAPFRCAFKVPNEVFEEWCSREGIIPAPYMARARWVQVADATKLSKQEWEKAIKTSYELVKAKLTKKARTELGIA